MLKCAAKFHIVSALYVGYIRVNSRIRQDPVLARGIGDIRKWISAWVIVKDISADERSDGQKRGRAERDGSRLGATFNDCTCARWSWPVACASNEFGSWNHERV